jgi:uncharacterized protein (DUF1501 family)
MEITAFSPRLLSFNPQGPRGDVLVAVFLRGAADALNLLVPHGEAAYYRLRPGLGIPRPDDARAPAGQRVIDLDGFFGLHPALAPLLPLWQAGRLAAVHACGQPDESRSHFLAQELMERGAGNPLGPASGWIGRYLAALSTDSASPARAVALGELPQRSLSGPVPVSVMRSIADFHLPGDEQRVARFTRALGALYRASDVVGQNGRETLGLLDSLAKIPVSQTGFPESDFARGLAQVAALVRSEVGLEAAAIDLGGWDTHFAQGGAQGLMAGLLADLAGGLAAFDRAMGDGMRRVSLVVMSEFGRRAYENASLGTDHGHGGVMLLLGGGVRGGRVHGRWPGLEPQQLFGPGDLAVTTDYRDVLFEMCQRRLASPAPTTLFPGYQSNSMDVFE